MPFIYGPQQGKAVNVLTPFNSSRDLAEIKCSTVRDIITFQKVPSAGADPGFFQGGVSEQWLCISYIIIYILQLFTLF